MVRPEPERRLLASLAEVGQQVPIVVVQEPAPDRYVVIDGYQRIRQAGGGRKPAEKKRPQ